jgi:SAM-dependent methyltransferase
MATAGNAASEANPPEQPSGALPSADELTFWEKVNLQTRWGRYTTAIEEAEFLAAVEIIGRPGTSLEIGCDGGRWSGLLAKQGWKVICTDVRPEALTTCKLRVPSAECILVQGSESSLPCATESIDLLLCLEVESVVNSEWFLPEAARVLKPGGILVSTLLNRHSLRASFHRTFNSWDHKGRRMRWYYEISHHGWRARLRRAGLQVIREVGFCWPPFGRDSNSPLVPLFVGLEKYLGLRCLVGLSPWILTLATRECNAVRNV